ncbi:unnamed protein product [Blepharisma stoltei]|uniref:SAP domain-containing protein n=1 Tax=Blepharisma stoltei TaxID=1481888 RepID=A0AAU9K1E0_9CILI|nr:unnamed protein product [Blepharisma stoltei]
MDFDADQEDVFIGGDEEEAGQRDFTPQKDEVIFLVDCNPTMFAKNQEGQSPFYMVMDAAYSYFKDKILASESDNLALIFYNTGHSKNHMDFKGLYVFQELGPPDAPRIKALQQLRTNEDYKFGHSDALLVEALWLCHDLLTQKHMTASRRIFLFTNQDRPNQNKPNDMQRALQRAKDLAEQDIMLELFPFNQGAHKFDFEAFFAGAIALEEDEAKEPILGAEKLEDLIAVMHKKEYKKRTLGTLNFMLSPTMKVAVNYYCMFRATKKPSPVKLHAKDNKKLKTITTWVCEETGKQLWDHELGFHYELGGIKIPFTKEEVKQIKDFDTPGLKLMGFKSRNKIKAYMNVRPSYFIYPEDNRIRGSSQVINSLINAMIKLNKVGMVRIIPRQGALVRFGALLPSLEPPGFNLVFLPFADDMRNPENIKGPGQANLAPDDLVKSAANMIQHIQIAEYNIHNYFNPTIQHFYTRLEALALDAPEPQPIIDALEPDEEGIQKNRQFIEGFFDHAPEGNRKRQREPASAPAKKVKNDSGKSQYSEAELKKMKVNELKDICDSLGLPKTGRKDELIERILSK